MMWKFLWAHFDQSKQKPWSWMGQFFENRGEDPNFRRIDLETYQSDSLQNFFVIRVIACTLWKNWIGSVLSILTMKKLHFWKIFSLFAEMRERPTWRAWNVQFCTFFRGSRSKNVQFLYLIRDNFGTFCWKSHKNNFKSSKFSPAALFGPQPQ